MSVAATLRDQAAWGVVLYPVIEITLDDRMLSRSPAARQHLLRRSEYARLATRLDTMPVIGQA
jgi:hypothetical protein